MESVITGSILAVTHMWNNIWH